MRSAAGSSWVSQGGFALGPLETPAATQALPFCIRAAVLQICPRPTRQFRVEGPPAAVARSVEVMCDAVARYKELCEGKYSGGHVGRVAHLRAHDMTSWAVLHSARSHVGRWGAGAQ